MKAWFDSGDYLEGNAIIPVRVRIVQEWLARVRDSSVLDVGCGDGSISRPLLAAQNRLTLVDLSSEMLDRARAATPPAASVAFVQADILNYFPAKPYDVVICVGVLAHVGSVEQAIYRVSSALRPGGLCIFQITDDSSPLGWLLNRYYHMRYHDEYDLNLIGAAELMAMASRHDLVPLRSRRCGLQLPGLGRLPHGWECRAEMAVAMRPKLSRLGADLLVCLGRTQHLDP